MTRPAEMRVRASLTCHLIESRRKRKPKSPVTFNSAFDWRIFPNRDEVPLKKDCLVRCEHLGEHVEVATESAEELVKVRVPVHFYEL